LQYFTPWENISGIRRENHPVYHRQMNVILLKEPAILNVPIEKGKQQKRAIIGNMWGVPLRNPEVYTWMWPLLPDNLSKIDLSQHEINRYFRDYAPQIYQ
jgi:hypothetical protein